MVVRILVWGPTAAGKSVRANQIAVEHGVAVIDLDVIAREMGFPVYGRTRDQGIRCLAEFNRRIDGLGCDVGAVVVACAAGQKYRESILKRISASGAELVCPGRKICRDRVLADPNRVQHQGQQFEAIDRWYDVVEHGG